MGTKIIGIREDVYETLKSMKREDESISDAIEKQTNKKLSSGHCKSKKEKVNYCL